MAKSKEPTLHEALNAAGYRAESGAVMQYGKRIVRIADGECDGEMRAGEAWAFLRSLEGAS